MIETALYLHKIEQIKKKKGEGMKMSNVKQHNCIYNIHFVKNMKTEQRPIKKKQVCIFTFAVDQNQELIMLP